MLLMMNSNLDQKYIDFMTSSEDTQIFVHRTLDGIPEQILEKGFRFKEFYTTTDPGPGVEWHKDRTEAFGPNTVVLGISRETIEKYHNLISEGFRKVGERQFSMPGGPAFDRYTVFQYLTQDPEEGYASRRVLPKQFVKGYFNDKEGKIVENPDYDPEYDSPKFAENIQSELERLISISEERREVPTPEIAPDEDTPKVYDNDPDIW